MKTSDEYAQGLAKTWAFSDEQVDDIEATIREAMNDALEAARNVVLDEKNNNRALMVLAIERLRDVRS